MSLSDKMVSNALFVDDVRQFIKELKNEVL